MTSEIPAFSEAKSFSFVSIQHLRAVAAMSVVIFHVGFSMSKLGYEGYWSASLSSGVDIFFVISGFIMWKSTRNRVVSPMGFMRNRIRRIAPLYWVVTSLVLAVLLISPNLMDGATFKFWHVIKSYLFIAAEYPGKSQEVAPLLMVGWTLNYEFFFYAIFSLTLSLPVRFHLAAICIPLMIIVFLGEFISTDDSVVEFYTAPIIIEFLLGIIIGILHDSMRDIHEMRMKSLIVFFSTIAIILAIIFLSLLKMEPGRSDWMRLLLFGFPAVIFVAGALSIEMFGRWPNIPMFQVLGEASYSIYLVHGIILSALTTIWLKLDLTSMGGSGLSIFFFTATIASTLGGIATWYLIESPIDRWLRNGRRKPTFIKSCKF